MVPARPSASYLFIVSDFDNGFEVVPAVSLLARRLDHGAWPLNPGTKLIRAFAEGDKAYFYVARRTYSVVAARATIVTPTFKPTDAELGGLLSLDDRVAGTNLVVRIEDVKVFPRPVPAAELRERLEFFAGAGKFWGARLQGGVRRLSSEDAARIEAMASDAAIPRNAYVAQ